MTNAQKWVTFFLVLFVLLFLLSKITEKEEAYYYEDSEAYPGGQEEVQMDGLALMEKINCTTCHGADLKGTGMAPALYGVKEYWDRDALINYLRNPSSYSGDKRFTEYKKKYPSIIMPSYNNIDVKELGRIADYLLDLD